MDVKKIKIGLAEIYLIQMILYALVYLGNSYIGFMLCLIMAVISFALLILSLIFEVLDRSNVPRYYFKIMISAIISPVVIIVLFSTLDPTSFDWMVE